MIGRARRSAIAARVSRERERVRRGAQMARRLGAAFRLSDAVLAIEDTRFFEHISSLPERFYPKNPKLLVE